MARSKGRFRIPMFRVFYSITYTTLYLLCLLVLAITPISVLWSAIQNRAYQYVFMVGGSYVLTAVLAIFIYSSRLYTNRSTLAAVGKAYLPIEAGEVGKMVRKMIVKQLERSAVIAWEGKPRDLFGEILQAEDVGVLPAETRSVNHNSYTVGTEIRVDPQNPPWGDVRHVGWSSPSHSDENKYPNVRFADVIEELPHLIEARAVSLAPLDPTVMPAVGEGPVADAAVINVLQRPPNMALREYITQLSYLGIFRPAVTAQQFLNKYERSRFSGRPASDAEFNSLMSTFSDLLAGMAEPDPAIVKAIHDQIDDKELFDGVDVEDPITPVKQEIPRPAGQTQSPDSSLMSPVTAREMNSRNVTPFLSQAWESQESFASVIHNSLDQVQINSSPGRRETRLPSSSSTSLPSESGSVLRHDPDTSGYSSD